MNMPKEASINLIGLRFETYTHACQSTNHTSNNNGMQQNSWTSSGMELTVRRKLARLDDAYNVFHAPIYTYIYFRMMPFSNKALEDNIWEYI